MAQHYRELKSLIFQTRSLLRKGELLPAINQLEEVLSEMGKREFSRTLLQQAAWASELEKAFSLARIDWYTYRTEKLRLVDLLQDILDDLDGLLQKMRREEIRQKKGPQPATPENVAEQLEKKYALSDRVKRLIRKSRTFHERLKDLNPD